MRSMLVCGWVLVALIGGWAASPERTAATGPHSECLVCKANADLACVDVAVDGATADNAVYLRRKWGAGMNDAIAGTFTAETIK